MPVRTITEELCDVCYAADQEETPATDRLRFGWQGREHVLLVCDDHIDDIRDTLQAWSELASGGRTMARAPRGRRAQTGTTPSKSGSATLFSQLDSEEKDRFRAWADMPNARRISDARVQAWIDAGRP
ncbi:MAG TPA: hypothetical protein VFP54_10690 [Acidimicrobiales bacterium]|nr:hypothetical protein [Acidimicrobiales bacterium]